MADAPIARLRAKARVILTSIQGLVVQAQTTLDRGEVLAQFATLQSQFDELRNDIATSRVLVRGRIEATGRWWSQGAWQIRRG